MRFDKTKLKAVVFDMDGVLVDSEPVYYHVEQKLFRSLGISISKEKHHSFVGMSMRSIWEIIRESNQLELTNEELIRIHKELMIKGFESLSDPQPINGIPDLLEFLINQGISTAVASSSSHQLINVILSKTGIKEYFSIIVSGDDVEAGKPEPDIFLKTLDILELNAENVIVIEDSANGISAARNAGIFCVAYKNQNSGNQLLDKADMIITDFHDFRSRLNSQIIDQG